MLQNVREGLGHALLPATPEERERRSAFLKTAGRIGLPMAFLLSLTGLVAIDGTLVTFSLVSVAFTTWLLMQRLGTN